MLDVVAPDADVMSADPGCERQQHNSKPTRRAKIEHLLRTKGIVSDKAAIFVEVDVANILDLFGTFNAATHGPAGRHDLTLLKVIKDRVKGGILFLAGLAA